jgi:outer membrane lipoprotein-sorting protein
MTALPARPPVDIFHFAFCLASIALLSGCAAKRLSLPTDPGSPLTDFAEVHEQVSAACRGARSVTAELGLSGRAGGQSLRGRVVSGFERPASMRLEGVAPFGQPVFVLVARGGEATLLLPRDERVVRGAKPEEILGALTGVALAPADLQAVLTGCVVPTPKATAGRVHRNGWASIDLEGGAVVYLQRDGAGWRVRAARRGDWQIEYPAWQGSFPAAVALRSGAAAATVDLTASVSQLEVNVDLDAAAFTVSVPPAARALSVEELRESGPLRDRQ